MRVFLTPHTLLTPIEADIMVWDTRIFFFFQSLLREIKSSLSKLTLFQRSVLREMGREL